MKRLIINADDFGMSHEANKAILDLLKERKISSASLMANGIYYEEAVSMIHEYELENIGVHLTLTRDDFEVKNPLLYSSLTDARSLKDNHGNLYQNVKMLKLKATFCDLLNECETQYIKLLNDDINFTHIDNHMYTLFPGLGLKGYLAMLMAYQRINSKEIRGIRFANRVKPVNDMYEIWTGRKMTPIVVTMLFFSRLKFVNYVYSFPFNSKNVPFVEDKRKCFENFLDNLEDGVTELHIHPCMYSNSISSHNSTWKHRVQEYELFKTLDLKRLLEHYDVQLISYKDLFANS